MLATLAVFPVVASVAPVAVVVVLPVVAPVAVVPVVVSPAVAEVVAPVAAVPAAAPPALRIQCQSFMYNSLPKAETYSSSSLSSSLRGRLLLLRLGEGSIACFADGVVSAVVSVVVMSTSNANNLVEYVNIGKQRHEKYMHTSERAMIAGS